MLDSLERAREAERRFLADASHELRTPLTALRGNVAHLARHGATPELSPISRPTPSGSRASPTTCSRSRARRRRLRPSEDVRLDELARAVRGAGRRRRGRACDRRRRPRRARAGAREPRRERAAPRPAGGRVTVTVRRATGRRAAHVEDEGAGARAGRAEHAFERFWRAQPTAGGSGLGLAIVRATAERHGGRAYVDGARFTIELPGRQESFRVRRLHLAARISRKDRREALPHAARPRRLIAARRRRSSIVARGRRVAVAASGGGGPTPPPKPLAQAIHDALAAPRADGRHRADHVHEQPLPVGRARRARRARR